MKTKLNFNIIACITMIMSGVLSMKSLAQDFSVKKDIISKDKIPYAKITGKMSVFKPADLLVSSLNDEPYKLLYFVFAGSTSR